MPTTHESVSTDTTHSKSEQFNSAQIYRKLVGPPKPEDRIDDPAVAEAMAHGTKHLMEKVHPEDRRGVTEGVIDRLQADRLAHGIGQQYAKTAAGEQPAYEIGDPREAEAMAHAARDKMQEALWSQDSMDAMRSYRAGDQMLADAGTPRYEGPVGVSPDGKTTTGDLILSARDTAARKRAEADILAEDARADVSRELALASEIDQHLGGRERAMALGGAGLKLSQAVHEANGDVSGAEDYEKSAQRCSEAYGLAYDMARNPGLYGRIIADGRRHPRDRNSATIEMMARAGLRQFRKAQKAEAKGNLEAAAKHRLLANNQMLQAEYVADFDNFSYDGLTQARKHLWEVWKY